MTQSLSTTCCIAGGGPAGMMLGFLLARAGVDVIVLEKHADFLRDFRGDTIHPSTLELMHELGLLEEFLRRPHQKVTEIAAHVGDEQFRVADFSHLPTRCKFIAFMPQWEFLDFLTTQARRRSTFRLMMECEATDLIDRNGTIAGLRARTHQGEIEIAAKLFVGADGRHSRIRAAAGLEILDLSVPMDVLWLRMSKKAGDPALSVGRFDAGRLLVQIDRGEYWQCAFVITKGSFDVVRERGLDALRAEIAKLAPHLADRVGELAAWDDVRLLTVSVDRLKRWAKPGVICIGDAAHAMSPIGGVGINLAIQDAVAAANLLYRPLKDGLATSADLDRVQRRRERPTRWTQSIQVTAQNRVIAPLLAATGKVSAPLPLRLLRWFPYLRRIPARVIGLGFRPEHVHTPDDEGTVKSLGQRPV
jgi:2-polyprenyl-6-methoxyphenol hydroxylase-like FAD-dependent oxidoreductase